MSEQSVETVKSLLDAFARRDLERLIELTDGRVQFFARSLRRGRRSWIYEGHEGVREFFAAVVDEWKALGLETNAIYNHGDFVVADCAMRGTTLDGRPVLSRVAWACRLEDGRIIWGRVYPSLAEALRAVEVQSSIRDWGK